MSNNKQWINENTAKIEALAQRVEGITLDNKEVADELETQSSLLTSLETAVDKLPEPKADRLQWVCDNIKKLYETFKGYAGTSLDEVLVGLDTSQVTSMENMFYNCTALTKIPLIDTSSCTRMVRMFQYCYQLTEIPQLDTSSCTNMSSMFNSCSNLVVIPKLNTSKVTDFSGFCTNCNKLTDILGIDLIEAKYVTMFSANYDLTNLTLKNIKVTLQIGSSTTWGTKLTDESLINTAKELWDFTGSTSQKLTVSTPSLARFSEIYVKLVDVTDDMIANDEYITNKKPCVVCASTDEGAMTLQEYVVSKNWQLA